MLFATVFYLNYLWGTASIPAGKYIITVNHTGNTTKKESIVLSASANDTAVLFPATETEELSTILTYSPIFSFLFSVFNF
ncbi:MAG: hypothetical protein ABI402_14120 [Ferruginibacter sp.]